MDDIVIRTENLEYVYQKGMPFESAALTGVNISIKRGSFTAIIGHTGSGKSTLVQHFNALIKPPPGRIFIDGEDISSAEPKKLRMKVGMVFQYPEHQLFEETVYKDIAYGPVNMGLAEDEINGRVIEAARLTGLGEDVLDRSPFELSGGQKRRAAIAGVIAMRPSVLILDEPAAGLDPAGGREIMTGIRRIHSETPGMTVVFVSHSMEDVAGIADNVIVMNKGTAAMTGSVDEIFSHSEELAGMGLAVPEVTRVTDILRARGVDIPAGIYTVEAAADAVCRILGDRLPGRWQDRGGKYAE
ncbi:MAG: energy-coupling factor transporter ATPase [Oscillospiraceae bacterium]|nr:energy-coupling factor transporter ATPase [Oscillospiraceae bacterium]